MAKSGARAKGGAIPAIPPTGGGGARPASPGDPATSAPHPTSRKPNAPTAGGHGGGK